MENKIIVIVGIVGVIIVYALIIKFKLIHRMMDWWNSQLPEPEEVFDFVDQALKAKDESDVEDARRRVKKEKRIREIESELDEVSDDSLDKRIESLIRKSEKK